MNVPNEGMCSRQSGGAKGNATVESLNSCGSVQKKDDPSAAVGDHKARKALCNGHVNPRRTTARRRTRRAGGGCLNTPPYNSAHGPCSDTR